MRTLTPQQARRIAVRAQRLDARRPAGLHEVVRDLTFLQVELTRPLAPSADLVLWSRLGSGYDPEELELALGQHELVDVQSRIRPADDLVLHRAEMDAWPGVEPNDWQRALARWVDDNDVCRRDVLARIEADGPLFADEIPDTCVRPWRSSGWNSDRNVAMMLEQMEARGEVAVAGRKGRQRRWDLASRIHPDDAPWPLAEADRERRRRRLAALGIARERVTEVPGEPNHVGDVGEIVTVEGVRGRWRVDPDLLEGVDEPFTGRTALLSPFDRLVFDRKRAVELFDFDFAVEIYKPAAKRRWGFYALPVLHDDELVGKLDLTLDRDARLLRVNAVHADTELTSVIMDGLRTELADLGTWLGVDVDAV